MKHCFTAIISAALLLSCTSEELVDINQQNPDTDVAADNTTDIYVPGEAYVYFSEEMTAMIEKDLASGSVRTKSESLNQTMDALGIKELRRLFPHAGEFEPRTRREGLHRWYIVRYSEDIPRTKAEMSIKDVDGVEYIEPVRQIKINDFNDLTSSLWGLYNTNYSGYDINVKPVWSNYTTGNPKVIVAVVDEGVDLTHEDLAGNCLSSGHYNSVDDNSVIVAGDHGTHVAGTIAAVSNNNKGIAGIAGGDYAAGKKGIGILSCQIFKDTPEGTLSGNSAAAIKWGADNGAVISQNSWGYSYDADGDGSFSAAELENVKNAKVGVADKTAIDYFIKYAGCDNDGNQLPDSPMKGGVVFFAAGNDAIFNGAPGNYSEVIAVGSITQEGTRSTFSNYGDWVDIAAPGSNIYSTLPGNEYGSMNGTSMACPHVSGTAALIVSHFGGAGFTNEMLKDRILGSSNTTVLSPAYQIGGLLDAYGAFVYGSEVEVDNIETYDVSAKGNAIDISWIVPGDSNNEAAYGFLILYGKDKTAVDAADQEEHNGVDFVTCIPEKAIGETAEFRIEGLEFEQEYHIKMMAYSYSRSYSKATEVSTIKTTVNSAPIITTSYNGDYKVMSSQTLNIPINVSDPDGHDVTVTFESGSTADELTSLPDGTWRVSISGKNADEGTYTAKIIAADKYGLSTTYSLTYEILENMAPVKIKDIENIMLTGKGKEFTLDMKEYVNDPDGEQLKYDINSSDNKIVHLIAKGDAITGTALSYGKTDVTIIAKDARGEYVEFSFRVLVKDPSDPLTVYPNPVTDYVYVSTLDSADTDIKITSQTGKTMFENTMKASAFEPAKIDMSTYAPGVYIMTVTFDGSTHKETIIKI